MPHTDPAQITFLILDVDGCLTDGSVALDQDGRETKRFNIKDGLGIRAWQDLGYGVAIITGRTSGSLAARAAELGIERVTQGAKDKAAALQTVLSETGVDPAHVAAIGDDWNDFPVLERVGFPACPSDAADAVRRVAAFVCEQAGGRGAVRELIEHLLSARGELETAMARYRGR